MRSPPEVRLAPNKADKLVRLNLIALLNRVIYLVNFRHTADHVNENVANQFKNLSWGVPLFSCSFHI